MAGILDYSTTAASNTSVGGVSIAEGMPPGNVNNAMRAMMADSRKWQIDASGVTTTAGAGNAYTFASQQGVTTYTTGMRFGFEADKTCSGATTFAVDAAGAKTVKKYTSAGVADTVANDIRAGAVYDVVYEAGADVFILLNPALDQSLQNFADLGTGIVVRNTGDSVLVRTLTAGAGIVVTNGGGVSGNPTVAASGITTAELAAATLVTAADTIASNDNDTTLPTSAAVKDYADAVAILGTQTSQVTTSGTEFIYTIPTDAMRITVMLFGVSLSASGRVLVQVGDGSSFETSGYSSLDSDGLETAGFSFYGGSASDVRFGIGTLMRMGAGSNEWNWVANNRSDTSFSSITIGQKSVSLTVSRINITRAGAGTFDAGRVNIIVEK